MRYLIRAVLLIGVLFGSLGLHELGHYVAFRLLGTGVDRYQVGLGPVILHHEGETTDFAIGALPIAGFVKASSSAVAPTPEEQKRLAEARPARLAMLLDHDHSIERLSHGQRFLALLAGPAMHGAVAWGAMVVLWCKTKRRAPTFRVLVVRLPLVLTSLVARSVIGFVTLGRYAFSQEQESAFLLAEGMNVGRGTGWWGDFLHFVAFVNWSLLGLNLVVPISPLDGGKMALELVQLGFGEISEVAMVWVNFTSFALFMTLVSCNGLLRRSPAKSG